MRDLGEGGLSRGNELMSCSFTYCRGNELKPSRRVSRRRVEVPVATSSPFPPVTVFEKHDGSRRSAASKLNDSVAARDDAWPRAARISNVIFCCLAPTRDPRREDCFLQVQHVSNTCRCELGQRSRRSHTRCDFFDSNPCCTLGPTTAHILPAISTGDSVPLDSHTWTDRQNTRGCS